MVKLVVEDFAVDIVEQLEIEISGIPIKESQNISENLNRKEINNRISRMKYIDSNDI